MMVMTVAESVVKVGMEEGISGRWYDGDVGGVTFWLRIMIVRVTVVVMVVVVVGGGGARPDAATYLVKAPLMPGEERRKV